MDEGRRDNLITERTYEINRKRLEKWVNASYNKIEDNQRQRSSRKPKIQTNKELLQAAHDGQLRLQLELQKIININEGDRMSAHSANGRQSGRHSGGQQSHLSISWRAGQTAAGPAPGSSNQYPSYRYGASSSKVENYTDRDPYGHAGNIGATNTTN